MKLLSYGEKGSERFGILHPDGKHIIDVNHADSSLPCEALAFVRNPDWDKLGKIVDNLSTLPGEALIDSVRARLGAPILNPGQIIAVGLNYGNHAKEGGRDVPKRPILFSKGINSVNGPNDDVVYHEEVEKLDYEVELGVVIGKRCKKVLKNNAPNHILGYTVFHDVSARCAQFSDKQFFRGKSMDTFAPYGPWIVTKNEVEDPFNLDLSCKVNGETRQSGNTSDMIFDIPFLIEYISKNITLYPGDIIATGTPDGVGFFNDGLLKKGDLVELTVQDIGTIKNKII